jgi:hypothetical protein
MSPEIDLRLPSGICFHDPAGMLKAKFAQWPWERYDDAPPLDANVVTKADIDRVYQLGARTSRAVYERLIDVHGVAITGYLESIPATPLEDVDLDTIRGPIVELFDLVLGVKSVKLAAATKLLYPFRPALFAVLDSVVDYYYWYATSIRDERHFRRLQSAGWGTYVFELLSLLQVDVRGAQSGIDRVLAACAGQPYAKASRVRVVESLLWYYYARGGRLLPGED